MLCEGGIKERLMAMDLKLVVMLLLVALFGSWVSCCNASVSYDNKAIKINGQRKILISGSIHYPRSTPEVFSLSMCLMGLFDFP